MSYPALSPDFPVHHRGEGPGWVNVIQTRQYGRASDIADAMPSSALGHRDGYGQRPLNERRGIRLRAAPICPPGMR